MSRDQRPMLSAPPGPRVRDAPTGADDCAILSAKVGKKGKATLHVMFLLDRNNIVMATMAIVGGIVLVALAVALVRALREEAREGRMPRERPLPTPPPPPEGDPPPPPTLGE